ncbi:MAG TPA: permease prefix domain 1-containing protein [Candidatus Acidoferrum sp.]|jgi:hypothetical protein|nr:permease prefix domain 1-containing protein [Candidatus Acidoferrum sp.]
MPDWQELVRQRLRGLALDAAEKEEVHAELAAHLEETYEALLRKGMTESEAIDRALSLAGDWHDLQRGIYSARIRKDTMTNRVTQLWLPGLLTFVLSSGILALLQIFGPKPWILAMRGNLPLGVLNIPWALLLPLVGALGAYLSWRAGGSRRAILSSIIFPVLPFLASILVVLPVSLIFDQLIAQNIAPMSLVMALLGWVLVPGVALLAGGLPARLYFSRRTSSQHTVAN